MKNTSKYKMCGYHIMFVSISITLAELSLCNSSRYKKAGKDWIVVADGKDRRGAGVLI